jgi:hypothetical protein
MLNKQCLDSQQRRLYQSGWEICLHLTTWETWKREGSLSGCWLLVTHLIHRAVTVSYKLWLLGTCGGEMSVMLVPVMIMLVMGSSAPHYRQRSAKPHNFCLRVSGSRVDWMNLLRGSETRWMLLGNSIQKKNRWTSTPGICGLTGTEWVSEFRWFAVAVTASPEQHIQ